MKARIIAKQKFKFIIDADIFETLFFGLLFSNSEEDGDEEYSLNEQICSQTFCSQSGR